jgi:AcrR family transcriptional regulator
MPNFTKEAIKKTFLELLDKMPLNKITVKMIVEKCGINRNSFYYHYEDLPNLIEEIINEEADRIMLEYPDIKSAETAMRAACDFASKNRRAILHIYNSVNRDIFEIYLWRVCDYVISSYGKNILDGKNISEPDREIIIRFYRCECFGIVIEWLNERMETDMQSYISRLFELHHGMAEEMIRRSMDG